LWENPHVRADPQPHQGHRRVRAAELAPHELSYRLYPQLQRAAVLALEQEVRFQATGLE
jgi:hypothetical protein